MFAKRKIARILSFALAASLGTVLLSGCGFKETSQPYKVNLEIWGIIDDSDAYTRLLGPYRQLNPYVGDITYRKLSLDTYKQDLLDALAAGKGPDIFMIQNRWLPSFADKVVPAPDYITDERAFRETFADVVGNDFIGADKKIYSVPLSVDSLALYYNKDMLSAAGIANPPATWEELAGDAQLLTKVDAFGNIIQSGVALGTAYNINRASDVLTAMMLQAGVQMWDGQRNESDVKSGSAQSVLDFYTRFANGRSAQYSWNLKSDYSLDAFASGKTAMMVNYSWQYAALQRKNAKLNFAVAPLPQVANGAPVNYANYWSFVVTKNKAYDASVQDVGLMNRLRTHEAWQFLKYLAFPHPNNTLSLRNGITGNAKDFTLPLDPALTYLQTTQKPAARRDLIEAQKRDTFLGPFAEGNLITRNWYQADPEAVEGILLDTINAVNLGQNTLFGALDLAQTRIERLNRR